MQRKYNGGSGDSRFYQTFKRRLSAEIEATRVMRAEIRGYARVVGETWDRKQNDRCLVTLPFNASR